VMNGLAMQDVLERRELNVRVMSAVSIHAVCEDYIRRRAMRHLEQGRVVVLVGGTGNPFFTTDSGASLRAVELKADLMIKATKVDGVYSADPTLDASAERYDHLTYNAVLDQRLGVMDATAIVMCRDQQMPLMVVDINEPGNLVRAVTGEPVGTLVTAENEKND
ncbi:MAG: uridine monophosphate kinase, partial [Guyparkeria sp.]